MEFFDELTGLDDEIKRSQLIITGEGRLDAQSALGKVVGHVSRQARAAGVPVIALCGASLAHNVDLDDVICLTESEMTPATCIARPREALALVLPRLIGAICSRLP